MVKNTLKPKGYGKLTSSERNALLMALMNFHEPVQAISNELGTIN